MAPGDLHSWTCICLSHQLPSSCKPTFHWRCWIPFCYFRERKQEWQICMKTILKFCFSVRIDFVLIHTVWVANLAKKKFNFINQTNEPHRKKEHVKSSNAEKIPSCWRGPFIRLSFILIFFKCSSCPPSADTSYSTVALDAIFMAFLFLPSNTRIHEYLRIIPQSGGE